MNFKISLLISAKNVCCFKTLSFGIICHATIDNYHTANPGLLKYDPLHVLKRDTQLDKKCGLQFVRAEDAVGIWRAGSPVLLSFVLHFCLF